MKILGKILGLLPGWLNEQYNEINASGCPYYTSRVIIGGVAKFGVAIVILWVMAG